MRIAVIGSGIAGLASAWRLSQQHEMVLYEANDYLGGHTHTHDVEQDGRRYAIDSGFIVFNPEHYPLLCALFDELGVSSHATTMSFSVHSERSGVEYNAHTLDSLFCQRRNLLSPRFLGMLRDLARFYRQAPALLQDAGPGPTLGEYLHAGRYGAAFRDEHLVPMASALWSSPPHDILAFPARYLVQFMANHQMLTLGQRAPWRVVSGGSASYVQALRRRWQVRERLSCPVYAVQRDAHGVDVVSARGCERYDHAVLACHSDTALTLLQGDADAAERDILGAMRYQNNEAVLHTDARLLPRRRKAWAAWNAHVPRDPDAPCTVSYCMSLLQGVQSPQPFIVTLNRDAIDPARVLRRMQYRHPLYDHAMIAAQRRKAEIQGRRRTWFAGAYWGWGFHEDGIRSAYELVDEFNAHHTQRHGQRSDRDRVGLPA